jgi:hypothetical protein
MIKKTGGFKRAMTNREIQLALIDNFVNLQKVLTNLTLRFDEMSGNINKLLQLFELSAKSFISKNQNGLASTSQEDKDLVNKLDVLLDQNKTIAKGLTLIEEKIRHKIYPDNAVSETSSIPDFSMPMKPRPLPRA